MVFANAVILVEGHGDKLIVDYLLERITGGAGDHYALRIAVIEASSIDNIPHLVRLGTIFRGAHVPHYRQRRAPQGW
ncbi:TOPRIM nucleotidyl transferase/hydrolase domain-containing protein [Propionibacteriaceae bacterium G57]|uniref:TOPRIM nucleotidyl transferase/hydrolase domain-containing protein n=1 Tax=Aestuariimicrobium sp. G57 TaxID=3418485 RepID=UPI003DA711CB